MRYFKSASIVHVAILEFAYRANCYFLFLEMFTLLWGPAKDSSLPYLITPSHLDTANSLGLACSYGTFPLGALVFGAMASIAVFINSKNFLGGHIDQEFVALWADGLTYLISATAIFSLTRVFRDIRKSQLERMEEENSSRNQKMKRRKNLKE